MKRSWYPLRLLIAAMTVVALSLVYIGKDDLRDLRQLADKDDLLYILTGQWH